jgi:hypothetical protein
LPDYDAPTTTGGKSGNSKTRTCWAGLKPGHRYCQADSMTARDVTLDQTSGVDLDTAKPFDSNLLDFF